MLSADVELQCCVLFLIDVKDDRVERIGRAFNGLVNIFLVVAIQSMP